MGSILRYRTACAAGALVRAGSTERGSGLDFRDQTHLVHGRDAVAAIDLEIGQHGQPQQRTYRIMRQRGSAAQGQLEGLWLDTCSNRRQYKHRLNNQHWWHQEMGA